MQRQTEGGSRTGLGDGLSGSCLGRQSVRGANTSLEYSKIQIFHTRKTFSKNYPLLRQALSKLFASLVLDWKSLNNIGLKWGQIISLTGALTRLGAGPGRRYSSVFATSTLKGGAGGEHHVQAALTPGKPGTECIGGWVGGQSGRTRKFSPQQGFDPRAAQPMDSRYTDWAIPAATYPIHLFLGGGSSQ